MDLPVFVPREMRNYLLNASVFTTAVWLVYNLAIMLMRGAGTECASKAFQSASWYTVSDAFLKSSVAAQLGIAWPIYRIQVPLP